MSPESLWLYLLRCENESYYAGYTRNLVARYCQHLAGPAGAKYTRAFKPVAIAQCWRLFDSVGMALRIEQLLKRQKRVGKSLLVQEPARLKPLVEARLGREVALFTFNPALLAEQISAQLESAGKRVADPFADFPAQNF